VNMMAAQSVSIDKYQEGDQQVGLRGHVVWGSALRSL